MHTQLKGKPIFFGLLTILVVSAIVLTASNIAKITQALQTPALTTTQIDSLAQVIVRGHQLMISQRQLQLDGIYTPQLDSLRSKISQLENENHKQDSVISYLRTYELPRTQVSVAPPKTMAEANQESVHWSFKRFDTWQDTLNALKKNVIRNK